MGKRKERRLAAKIGAGRRVKLDLFAEPSGDLGGSSANDEDGKDVDAKLDRELSNSPSSSGQPLENPLSLLGQYSDDDLDDVANEAATISDDDKQTKHSTDETLEEGEIVGVEDHTSQKADNLDVERESSSVGASLTAEADAKRDNMVSLDEKDCEAKIESQDHVPVASDKSTQGMTSTWRMVLHEESNRYYYWNTVTGETSWEIPDGLAEGTALVNEHELSAVNVSAPAFGVTLNESSAIHGVGYSSEISDMKAIYEPGAMVHQSLEQSKVDGSQFFGGFSVVGTLPYDASSLGHYSLSVQTNADVGNLAAGSQQGHDSALTREQGAVDYPSSLVKNGEALLERLKLLLGSGIDSAEHILLSKYMLEIEIRLSDIRCLLPYGSSLVPFWMHSDRQLSHLENAINTEIGKQNNKVSVLHASNEDGKETYQENGGDANHSTSMRKSPENTISTVHDVDTTTMVQTAVQDEASDDGVLTVNQAFLQETPAHLHSETKGSKEIGEPVVHGNTSPIPEVHSSEDMDMDIDMEVEDQSPSMNIGGPMAALPGLSVHPSAPLEANYLTPESEPIIPPPPEEEWIPPPPPDEDIPPPPPDEPPESLCPPPPSSELGPSPSITSEQHNCTYIEPSVNYFGNTIPDSLGISSYEHADVNQIAAITPPAYYAVVSNAQPISMLNPADSAAYYGIPNGALPVPVPTTIGSSNLVAPVHSNNEPLSCNHIVSVDEVVKAPSLSKQFVDPLAPLTDIASTQVNSASVASASAAVSTKEYASVSSYSAPATSVAVSSTSAAVSDASAAVSKAQSKASRVKKPKVAVASSLRSNKKVSSLVDKWKAAKEELREEEKEEHDPLEILEKKRQREIEGWRAQQIASGEAKENANFQPLGGDWRERVKRRRAQKEAAAGTTSDTVDNEIKQPDLSELSKGLPTGWQACWDDSSKMVYYANLITSETTWTRPTR